MIRSLILAGALCAMAGTAHADGPCMPVADLFAFLAQSYHEVEAAGGINDEGGGIAVTVNPATGAFTVIEGREGVACVIASGTAWRVQGGPA